MAAPRRTPGGEGNPPPFPPSEQSGAPFADDPSHGGWSDPGLVVDTTAGEPALGAPAHADPSPAARYSVGALLGRGGMGVVHAARDLTLGRDVALKELQPELTGSPTARARLAREAAITSRLDHPGIVAVHDAGRLADGRPYYTMRLVRGRTLARALADATSPASRRPLVRHLLAAAEAVGAAHDAGIVHRDLKPSNILIGVHGETQVVDWGVATPTEAAAARWADLPPVTTIGPVGTSTYMAPEQQQGAPAAPSQDVWSLGVTLAEVFGGASSRGTGVLPPEIAAIVVRATAAEPAARYPDAAALADDLLRWFEGRRVSAHVYTPRELLRRTLTVYRLPLRIGALGVLAVAVAIAVSGWQITRALDRALAAEVHADDALADLQLERAVEATRAGAREQAERLAASVLHHRDDPLARGVLAAFGREERPMLLVETPGPTCTWSALAPGDDDVLCGHADHIERWGPGGVRWSTAVVASGGRFEGHEIVAWDGGMTLRLDAATGTLLDQWPLGGHDWVPQVPPRRVRGGAPTLPLPTSPISGCRNTLRAAETTPDGRLAAVCADGTLLLGRVDRPDLLRVATDLRGDHDATALAWTPDGRVVVGTLRGRVVAFAGDTGAVVASGTTSLGTITTIAVAPDGGLVALGGTLGGVGLWRLATASLIGEVPAARPRSFDLSTTRLRIHDGALHTWRLPSGTPARVQATGGLADVVVAPTGDRVVLAGGDGAILTVHLGDGAVDRTSFGDRVVKAVAFSPDGASLYATGMAAPFVARFDAPSAAWIPAPDARPLRRLTVLADGALLGPDLDAAIYRWASPASHPLRLAPDHTFADLDHDGATVVVLDTHGGVARLDGDRVVPLVTRPEARAVAVRGARFVVATADSLEIHGVEVHGADGIRTLEATGASLLEVALSTDGRRVAAGGLDTFIRVWDADTGQLLGLLPGHQERVVGLEFLPDGDLVSVSWDKSARFWALGELTRPVDTLIGAVEAAWGGGGSEGRGLPSSGPRR